MAKLKGNVGVYVINNVAVTIYLGTTDTGRDFFFTLHDHDANSATPPKFIFFNRSGMINLIRSRTASAMLAASVVYANVLEERPAGLADANGWIDITNAPANMFDAASITKAWYDIKGTDVTTIPTNKTTVTDANLDAWIAGNLASDGSTTKTTTPTTDTNGDGVIDSKDGVPTAKGTYEKFQDFAKENPALVIGLAIAITILIALLYQKYGKKITKRKRSR